MEEERLVLKITVEATNSRGKVTLRNETLLGEMKLVDVIETEKKFLAAALNLLPAHSGS